MTAHDRFQSLNFGSTVGTFTAGGTEQDLADKTLSHYNNNLRGVELQTHTDISGVLPWGHVCVGGTDGDFAVT